MLKRRHLLTMLPPVALAAWAWRSVPEAWSSVPEAGRADFDERGVIGMRRLVASPLAARVVDPRPQRILVLGDSMIYNLLPLLADYCLQNGHELHPAIWWGSTSSGWAGSRKIDELLIRHRPTFIIVVLGSSEILGKGIDPLVTAAVHKLLQRVGDRKLIWVGPPNWRPDTGVNEVLERELGQRRFFRSAELVLEREDDGIHPTRAGGRVWAQHIIRWWSEQSAAPILLEPPTREARVPSATCYGAAWKVADESG